MEIKLSLALPREELSVPVVRRVLKSSLEALGVEPEVVHDIQVALTEAVTNVLDHATRSDEYEVSAGVDGDICVIEIVDRGGGFDGTDLGHVHADPAAEEGRGIQIMRALVDKVTFRNVPRVGTIVHLEKRLEWTDEAAIKLLSDGNPPTAHGPWSEPPPVG
ncbi:MAG: serine/threonine-protein kinase RsbW [Actinomycetota bacterium]|jgi:serine/threonine-protein kinase RsbW|nr:serine/threonine-protein kinase RsbW [Actinomycetota bacterium]